MAKKKSLFSSVMGTIKSAFKKKDDEKKKQKKQQNVMVHAAKSGGLGKPVQKQANTHWNQKGNKVSNGGGVKHRNQQPIQQKNRNTTYKQTVSAAQAKQNQQKLNDAFKGQIKKGFTQQRPKRNQQVVTSPLKLNKVAKGQETPTSGNNANRNGSPRKNVNLLANSVLSSMQKNNAQLSRNNLSASNKVNRGNSFNLANDLLRRNPQLGQAADRQKNEYDHLHGKTYNNAFDQFGTTLKDQKKIQSAQKAWYKASRRNDEEGMEKAHERAEKIRGKYGISTDESGGNPYQSEGFNKKANKNAGLMKTLEDMEKRKASVKGDKSIKNYKDYYLKYETSSEDDIDALAHGSNTQQKTYNYIYNTQGKKAAKNYIKEVIKPSVQKHEYETGTGIYANSNKVSADKQAKKEAKEHPVLSSVGTVASNLVMPAVGAVQNAASTRRGSRANQYSLANTMTRQASQQRQQVRNEIEKKHGKGLATVYDAGMAAADSMASQAFGKAGVAVMATSAANNAFLDKIESGADQNEAALYALINGGVEYATEKLPFGRIQRGLKSAGRSLAGKSARTSVKDLRSFARQIGEQAGIEGSEEFVSEVADNMADDVIFGENSERNKAKRQYMAQGMSEKDAAKQSMLEYYVSNPLQSFAVGALSGGMMITPTATIERVSTGKNIRSNSAVLDDLITKGAGVDDEKGRALAQRINEQRNKGQNPSKISVANLAGYVQQDAYDKLSVDSSRKQEIHDYASSGVTTSGEPEENGRLKRAFDRYNGRGIKEFSGRDFVRAWNNKSNEAAAKLNEYMSIKNDPQMSQRTSQLENDLREYKDYAEDLVNADALVEQQDASTRDMISYINAATRPGMAAQNDDLTDDDFTNPVEAQGVDATAQNAGTESQNPEMQETGAAAPNETVTQSDTSEVQQDTTENSETQPDADTSSQPENEQELSETQQAAADAFTSVANEGTSIGGFANDPDNGDVWLDQGEAGKGGYGTSRISERAAEAGEDPAAFAAHLAEAVTNPNHKASSSNAFPTEDANSEMQYAYNGYTAIVYYTDMQDGNGPRWTLMDGWRNGGTTQANPDVQEENAVQTQQNETAEPEQENAGTQGETVNAQAAGGMTELNTENNVQQNPQSQNAVTSENNDTTDTTTATADTATDTANATAQSPAQEQITLDTAESDNTGSADPTRVESFMATAKRADRQSDVYAPNDEEPIAVTYALVPVSSLVASNDANGAVNPEYPSEFQPRDRTRSATQDQINRMLGTLNPVKLLDVKANAAEGAPIVRDDGVVISGNMRTMTLQRMYESADSEKARDYARTVTERANELGIDTTDVPENPVLVGITVNNSTDYLKNLALRLNGQSTAAYSSTEQAQTDVQRVTGDLLSKLHVSDNGLNTGENEDFIYDFIRTVVPTAERGDMLDSRGNLSKAGRERIENAVFAYAYNDSELLERLSESLDNDAKDITNALLDVASKAAAFRQGVSNGVYPDIPLTETIIEAANIYIDSRANGFRTVEDYLSQGQFLVDENGEASSVEHSYEAQILARIIDANRRGAKQLRIYLNLLYDVATEDSQAEGQTDLFAMAADEGVDIGKSPMDRDIEDVFEEADRRYDELKSEEQAAGKQGRKGPRYERQSNSSADRTESETGERSESGSEQSGSKSADEGNSGGTEQSSEGNGKAKSETSRKGNGSEHREVNAKSAAKSVGYGLLKGSTFTVHKSISSDKRDDAKVINDIIGKAKKAGSVRANQYDIVRIQLDDNEVEFIKAKKFDTDDFPEITRVITVTSDGNVQKDSPAGQIIVDKAEYVPDSYKGFSVSEAEALHDKWSNAYKETSDGKYRYSPTKITDSEYFHQKFDGLLYGEESTEDNSEKKKAPDKKQGKKAESKETTEKSKPKTSKEKAQTTAKKATEKGRKRNSAKAKKESGTSYSRASGTVDSATADATSELKSRNENAGNESASTENVAGSTQGKYGNVTAGSVKRDAAGVRRGAIYNEAANYTMNKITAREWEKAPGSRGIRNIIRKSFNVVLGHTGYKFRRNSNVAGYYVHPRGTIHLKSIGDNATALHELGHWIDRRIDLSNTDTMYEFAKNNTAIVDELLDLGYSFDEVTSEIAADFIKAYIADPQFAHDAYAAERVQPTSELYDALELRLHVNPALEDKVKSLRAAVLKQDAQSTLKKVKASQSSRGMISVSDDGIRGKARTFLQEFVSKNYGLERMDKELRKLGCVIKTGNPAILKDIADNASAITEQNVERECTDIHGVIIPGEASLQDYYEQLFAKDVLKQVKLDPSDVVEANASIRQKASAARKSAERKAGLTKKQKIEQIRSDFDAYLKLKHSIDWFNVGKLTFAVQDVESPEQAQAVIDELDAKYKIPGTDDSLFEKVSQDIYDWNDRFMRRWLVEPGYLSAESYETMHEMYPHYVPNKRIMEEETESAVRTGVTTANGVKLMGASQEGSELDTYGAFESLILNVDSIIRGVCQNETNRAIWNLYNSGNGSVGALMSVYFTAEPDSSLVKTSAFDITDLKEKLNDSLLERALEDLKNNDVQEFQRYETMPEDEKTLYAAQLTGRDIIDEVLNDTIYKAVKTDTTDNQHILCYDNDGKTHQLKVNDKYILRAFERVAPSQVNIIARTVAPLTRTFTGVTTSMNILFSAKNAMRDFQHGIAFTPSNYNTRFDKAVPIRQIAEYCKDYAIALKDIIKSEAGNMDADYAQMQAYNSYVSKYYPGRKSPVEDMVENVAGTRVTASKVLDAVEKLNGIVESTPRLVAFRRGMQQTGDVGIAMEMSREVTANFWRKGRKTTALGTVVPFLNAGVAGLDQMRRLATDDTIDDRSNIITRALLSQGIIIVLSSLLVGFMGDKKKDELEMFSTYIRQNYYLIPLPGTNNWIRIPKDRELSALFGTSLQYAIDTIVNPEIKPGDELREYVKYVLELFTPPHELTGMSIVQAMHNETWYGGQIVGTAYEDLLYTGNYNQVYSPTTSRLAILISDFLCNTLKVPLSKDSKLGVLPTPMGIDYVMDALGGGIADIVLPLLKPGSSGTLNAILSNFTANPYNSNLYSSEIYDIKEKLASDDAAGKISDKDAEWKKIIDTFTSKSSEKEKTSDNYSWKYSIVTVSDYRQQIKDLQADTSLSKRERAKKIEEINEKIARISEEMVKDYKAGKKPKAYYGDIKEPKEFKKAGFSKDEYTKFLNQYIKLYNDDADTNEKYFATIALNGLSDKKKIAALDIIKTSSKKSGKEIFDKYAPAVKAIGSYERFEKLTEVPKGSSSAARYLKIIGNKDLDDATKDALLDAVKSNQTTKTGEQIRKMYQPILDEGVTVDEYLDNEKEVSKYSNRYVKIYATMLNPNLSETAKHALVHNGGEGDKKDTKYSKYKELAASGMKLEDFEDFENTIMGGEKPTDHNGNGYFDAKEKYDAVGLAIKKYGLDHAQHTALAHVIK